MYVCICKAVSEQDVRRALAAGASSARELVQAFNLDDSRCCGRCMLRVEGWIDACVEQGNNRTSPKLRPASGER